MDNKVTFTQNNNQPSAQLPHDTLLACLVLLTKYYERPRSARALVAGLPLENNCLTPDLFIRAAQHAELTARIQPCAVTHLKSLKLPTVLLLDKQEACLLLAIDNSTGKAEVIFPQTSTTSKKIELQELDKLYTGYSITVAPDYQFSQRSGETLQKSGKNWFWRVMWQSLPIYRQVLVASFLSNLFALAIPLFIMNVYDRVVPNHAIETMWVLASGVAIVFLFDFVMRTLRAYFIDHAGKQVDMTLSSNIFEQIMGIKMAARPGSVGAFVNTVQSFEIFRDFITSTTITVLVDLPFVFLYIAIIYLVGGNLFWIPMIMVPVVFIVGILLQLPMTKLTQESYRYAAEKQATLIESLGGVEAIKSTSAEGTMQRRWEGIVELLAKVGIKLRFVSNLSVNFTLFTQQLTTVLVVIFGVYKISEGEITIGALIACTILTGRALAPMSQVAALLSRYYQSVTALNSLDTVMHLPVDRPNSKKHLHRPNFQGSIELREVTFNYPESKVPSLDKVSFKINSGERVAIIGRIGSGKTTIAKMLLSLYQPTSGSIMIDNTDQQQIDPADLRNSIGYVPQDLVLLYGTVKDNIALGAAYIDDESILKSAKIAGVDRFLSQHPQGYDLDVGERGCHLSGGQRQCIAVARALLLNPPILIFDEPSASMDDSSEGVLKKNLTEYLNGQTLILVTHKASMLSMVDRIIIMDNGKIVADGPKEDILNKLKQGHIKTDTTKRDNKDEGSATQTT